MAMRSVTAISEHRACQLVGLSRTVLHYESKAQPENEQLKARLVEAAQFPNCAGSTASVPPYFTSGAASTGGMDASLMA